MTLFDTGIEIKGLPEKELTNPFLAYLKVGDILALRGYLVEGVTHQLVLSVVLNGNEYLCKGKEIKGFNKELKLFKVKQLTN